MRKLAPTIALLVALGLLAAACGDSSAATVAPEATTQTVAATAPPTTAPPTTTTAPPPTTTLPPTTTTSAPPETMPPITASDAPPASIVPGEDPDVDAVVAAFTMALDSTTDYAASASFIEASEDLEETVMDYMAQGDAFGGVGVLPTAVSVNGDVATVTYTLLFGGSPAYSDQKAEALRIDGVWKVSRASFCGLMRSARVGCP